MERYAGGNPSWDAFVQGRQLAGQQQQQDAGMLMKLVELKRQEEDRAKSGKYEAAISGLGANATPDQILSAVRPYMKPGELGTMVQGAENRRLQVDAARESRIANLGQRAQLAQRDYELAVRRQDSAEVQNQLRNTYNQTMMELNAANTAYNTGTNVAVPSLTAPPRPSAQNFQQEGGMSMPQQGGLSGLLQQQGVPTQGMPSPAAPAAATGAGFPVITPQVQAERDRIAAGIRQREVTGGGIPTASIVPGSTAGAAGAPVAPETQAPNPAAGPRYKAALAEVVPNEPPRVKFERLAAARKADLDEAKAGAKNTLKEKKEKESELVFNNTIDDIVGTIDQMIGPKDKDKLHPGLKSAVGTIDPLFPTVLKDTANFDALYKALLAKASVEGLTTIRGNGTAVGSITEKEWPIFQNFRAVLNDRQGEQAFVDHLKRYRDTLLSSKKAVQNAKVAAQENAPNATPAGTPPPPPGFKEN